MADQAAAVELLKEWRRKALKKLRAKKAKPSTIKEIQLRYRRALERLSKAGQPSGEARTVVMKSYGASEATVTAAQAEIDALEVRVTTLEGP
jgi:hypothetical protein